MPFIANNDVQIYYQETGTGKPVVLLHGFSVHSGYWHCTGVVEALAVDQRVITIDLRGHGQTRVNTQPNQSKGFNVETLVHDLHVVTQALGLARFHLVGHSLGGMIAVRYALRWGTRIHRLVLMSTDSATVLGDSYNVLYMQKLAAFAGFYAHRSWPEIFAHLRETPGPLLASLNQSPQRETLWTQLETLCAVNDPDVLAAFIGSFYVDPDRHLTELRQIACPTLLLVGEQDRLFVEASRVLAEAIPQAQRRVLIGVGHMLGLENPQQIATVLRGFLGEGV